MFTKDPRLVFRVGSSFLIAAVLASGWSLATGRMTAVIIPCSGLITLLWLYLILQRWLDGPSFARGLEDERMWQNSSRAMRNACWFFYAALITMVVVFNSGYAQGWKDHAGWILSAVVYAGLTVHMVSFLWFKYRV